MQGPPWKKTKCIMARIGNCFYVIRIAKWLDKWIWRNLLQNTKWLGCKSGNMQKGWVHAKHLLFWLFLNQLNSWAELSSWVELFWATLIGFSYSFSPNNLFSYKINKIKLKLNISELKYLQIKSWNYSIKPNLFRQFWISKI